MENIGDSLEGLPPGTDVIQGPRVQRQVLLRAGPERAPLVYASSWWNATEVRRLHMQPGRQGEEMLSRSGWQGLLWLAALLPTLTSLLLPALEIDPR